MILTVVSRREVLRLVGVLCSPAFLRSGMVGTQPSACHRGPNPPPVTDPSKGWSVPNIRPCHVRSRAVPIATLGVGRAPVLCSGTDSEGLDSGETPSPMKTEVPIWIGVAVLALAVTLALSLGFLSWAVLAFAVAGMVATSRLGHRLASEADGQWLPSLLPLAYLARIVGAGIHYYVVVVLYQAGDSLEYHRVATELVSDWAGFQVPAAPGGSAGTRFVELVTSLFYVPAVPSMFVGYLLFTSLSFLGSLALYLAFRRSFSEDGLRRYAILLFFLPSMLFWPSTIGKEALMILGIGLASYGASSLLTGGRVGSLVVLGLGLALTAAIRPHVAVMLAAGFVVAILFSRKTGSRLRPSTSFLIVCLTLVALWSLSSLAMTRLGIGQSTESLEVFLSEQERLTQTGGSAVVGSPVQNPLDLPEATLRVLFRPLPHEAHNIQAVLSALEGVFLLALALWRLPTIVRNWSLLRIHPYLLYSLALVAEFVVAFSSILNFGILARQRVQILPFLLVLLMAMGWDHKRSGEPEGAVARGLVPTRVRQE